jgi:hypothetical protein
LVDPPKRVTGGVHQYPVSEERNPIGWPEVLKPISLFDVKLLGLSSWDQDRYMRETSCRKTDSTVGVPSCRKTDSTVVGWTCKKTNSTVGESSCRKTDSAVGKS